MTPVYPAAGHDPYSWLLPPSGNLVRCVQGIQWPERIVEGFPEEAMSELKKVFVERAAALYSHKAAECGEEHSGEAERARFGDEETSLRRAGIYMPRVQFSSVAQSWPTLCDPMNCSTPGLPVHHQLPESTQTHVH